MGKNGKKWLKKVEETKELELNPVTLDELAKDVSDEETTTEDKPKEGWWKRNWKKVAAGAAAIAALATLFAVARNEDPGYIPVMNFAETDGNEGETTEEGSEEKTEEETTTEEA